MNKEASIKSNIMGLGKATSKLGVSSKNLARAIKNKDKSRALKAGAHIAKGLALPGAAAGAAYLSSPTEKGKSRREKAGRIMKENIIPSAKASMGQKALSLAGGAAGTAIQMKRGKSFSNAARTGGLVGMAAGDTIGSVAIPQSRFIKMHKKEFGTMPSAKDMGKLFAANTVPTAASWGAILSLKKPRKFYQNNADVAMGALKKKGGDIKNAFGFAASKEASKKGQAEFGKEFISKLKGTKDPSSNVGKTMAKAMLVDKAVDEAVDLPTKFVTPENLIRKKKESEDRNMNKLAFDVVEEAFGKIAKETKNDPGVNTEKKFLKDRLLPGIGLGVASTLGSKAGAKLGAKAGKLAGKGDLGKILTGIGVGSTVGGTGAYYGAIKGMQKHNEKKGYAKATGKDTAKTMIGNAMTLGLGYTPQTIAKDKAKKEFAEAYKKTACEVVADILYK